MFVHSRHMRKNTLNTVFEICHTLAEMNYAGQGVKSRYIKK